MIKIKCLQKCKITRKKKNQLIQYLVFQKLLKVKLMKHLNLNKIPNNNNNKINNKIIL